MAYLDSMENLTCNTMPAAEANICVVGADLTVKESKSGQQADVLAFSLCCWSVMNNSFPDWLLSLLTSVGWNVREKKTTLKNNFVAKEKKESVSS